MLPSSRRPRPPRGVSLIEGMAASAVLLIGLVGVLQGILVASRQNSMANRMTRAGTIAHQIRSQLQARGLTRLQSTGPLAAGTCASDPVKSLGGEASTADNACVIDLDAFDQTASVADVLAQTGYLGGEDERKYRRVLVRFNQTDIVSLAVVVSYEDAGIRKFVTEYVGLYKSAQNNAGADL